MIRDKVLPRSGRPGKPPGPSPRKPGRRNEDEHEDGGVAVASGKPKLKEPPKFAVVLLNDDYTTMEFVVEVLKRFFGKTEEQAAQIMLRVHHEGRGVAGIFSRDIAETKVVQVEQAAQARGYPLKCDIETAI